MNLDPNTIAAVFSAIAAVAAAFTAFFAHSYHQKIVESSHKLLKLEIVIKHFGELMLIFSEIRAISETDWSDNRSKELQMNAQKLKKTITIIGSLHPETGNSLDEWYAEKDKLGNSVSQIIDYELAQIGSIIKDKYNKFFNVKSIQLKEIQSHLFKEFSV